MAYHAWNMVLTIFLVEYEFCFEFVQGVEGVFHFLFLLIRRVRPEQELTGARPGHDLPAPEPRELAEAIGAVDDRVITRLRISQDKVAIWKDKRWKII